ncbi:unnamed protein product [Porites lobata]|uniref:G-protein coupled receptors family 1 profile domain-containing protein n=1 Tax=Porites lobata TaxID=104759 RepID=A0ABN8MWA6_9CNID|nr:unnamed protein product [Porites lobata]
MADAEEISPALLIVVILNIFSSYTAVTLNIITIYVLRKISSLPKPVRILLLSLAVSDLAVGLIVQPLAIATLVTQNNKYTFQFEKASEVFGICFTAASFLNITALGADRFLAIHLHLRYQELVTHRRIVTAVITIWVFSATVSLFDLWDKMMTAAQATLLAIVVVCFISTTFFYFKIYLTVRHLTSQIHTLQVQQASQNVESTLQNTASQRKSAIATFYVYIVFLLCYLPRYSIHFANMVSSHEPIVAEEILIIYAVTLVHLNSSLNPFIYAWKMRPIRHAIMEILRNTLSKHCS